MVSRLLWYPGNEGEEMKHLTLILAATMMHLGTTAAFAEDRAVANTPEESQQYEDASYEYSARSFFEPKTEADVNALVSLDKELANSLDQDN